MSDFNPPYNNPYATAEPTVAEGTEFVSGKSIADSNSKPVSVDAIIDALTTVFDPEIPVNIYDLGLIYKISKVEEQQGAQNDWDILMTLTAPACPVAGELPQQVADAAASIKGVGCVRVRLTWSPPWTPDMMSEDARYAVGM